MERKRLEELLNSDGLLERFTEVLIEEINADDESFCKKGRQLVLAALDNPKADDFFIAICGWNLDSLIDKL